MSKENKKEAKMPMKGKGMPAKYKKSGKKGHMTSDGKMVK